MYKIHLISGPRNISTALMYSFGNRTDFSIIDEPFYAYYLNKEKVDHPDREAVILSQSIRAEEVIGLLNIQNASSSYFFIKNMAHHIYGLDLKFILPFKNILLIRDPARIIWSFSKVVKDVTLKDIGIKQEFEIFQFLQEQNQKVIIINSDDLLENPSEYLKSLCVELDIPFEKNMENWAPGPRIEDGVWASHWYKNVHKTTRFEKQTTDFKRLPKNLIQVYEQALPYYNKLNAFALKN